jgi:SAM-dependent methyltransferase
LSEHGYLLDNAQREAVQRFGALATLFDDWTMAHLERLTTVADAHVWEVGAGGPSVPSRLAASARRVLATDIDTRWLDPSDGYEVLRHDVGVEAAPEGPFDLIHARLVLVHVADRDRALATMVAALAPGGWLLLEEADPGLQPLACLEETGEAEALANRLKRGFRSLMAERGVDLAFGRTLPRRLRAAGLVDVGAEAFFPVTSPACNELELATTEQIRQRLLDAGIATNDEIEHHLANVRAGRLDVATSPLVSAWGRRPL